MFGLGPGIGKGVERMQLNWTGTRVSYHVRCRNGRFREIAFVYSNVAVPLTPALSPRRGSTVDRCGLEKTFSVRRPRTETKAGSPLRSAPALHKVELNRHGLRETGMRGRNRANSSGP